MTLFRQDSVRVLVPASSANLGSGFDSAGLALALEDELVATVTVEPGVVVRVSGEGAGEVPVDESHLVVRAMNTLFDAVGARPAGLVLECTNRIPHGRGLGSSAAAIIGGMVLARALIADEGRRPTDLELLQTALVMESHPDNLSAALAGGATIAWIGADGAPDFVRRIPHQRVSPVIAIPNEALQTKTARLALPDFVPLTDAVHNLSRAALLMHALSEDPDRLLAATDDRVHQRSRSSMYPESFALMCRLREAGVAAFISGAGPSVLALADCDEQLMAGLAAPGWATRSLAVSSLGAREVDRDLPAAM